MSGALPMASCLCLTYGRPKLLREAVWCFLQQDYPNKELVIVNDHPNALSLDRVYPEIRLENVSQRFANLGQKRNFTTRLARGEILLVWDDDDLFLPWRISQTVSHLRADPASWAFKPTRAWISINNAGYRVGSNVFHSQLGLTRQAFDRIGGYPEMNTGEDVEFEKNLPRPQYIWYDAPVDELIYVYRWGNTFHISGLGTDQPGQRSSWEVAGDAQRDVPGGVIVPGFDRDHWQQLLDDAGGLPDIHAGELERLRRRLEPYHVPPP